MTRVSSIGRTGLKNTNKITQSSLWVELVTQIKKKFFYLLAKYPYPLKVTYIKKTVYECNDFHFTFFINLFFIFFNMFI